MLLVCVMPFYSICLNDLLNELIATILKRCIGNVFDLGASGEFRVSRNPRKHHSLNGVNCIVSRLTEWFLLCVLHYRIRLS